MHGASTNRPARHGTSLRSPTTDTIAGTLNLSPRGSSAGCSSTSTSSRATSPACRCPLFMGGTRAGALLRLRPDDRRRRERHSALVLRHLRDRRERRHRRGSRSRGSSWTTYAKPSRRSSTSEASATRSCSPAARPERRVQRTARGARSCRVEELLSSSRCFFHSVRNACWPAFAAAPADRELASISSARVEKESPRSSTASSTRLAAFFHASPVASAAWSSFDLVSAWRFFQRVDRLVEPLTGLPRRLADLLLELVDLRPELVERFVGLGSVLVFVRHCFPPR